MIKKVLLGSLILFSGTNFAQTYEAYGPYMGALFSGPVNYQYNKTLKERVAFKENQVKSREKIRYYKGEPVSTIEYFDNAGRLVNTEREFKNGTTGKTAYTYDETGNLIEYKSINAKNKEAITTSTFDSDNRLVAWESVNYKQEYAANKVAYHENGKLLYRRIYSKNKEKPSKELIYSYYKNGDPKTTEYHEKGKLKHSWKYDCKPEGELINIKNKDATTLCKIEEIDSTGNRVVWERKFDEKGKLSKTKTVYFSDSLIISRENYNTADKLVYQTNYSYDSDNKRNKIETCRFDKAGEAYVSSRTIYSKRHGALTTSYHKNGKIDYSTQYLRDENKKLVKSQRLDGRWSHTYLYNYKDALIQSEVRIHKNGTYVSEYIYDYY